MAAYGAFNAGGVDIQGKHNTDTFKFPGGSFVVTHKATRTRQHFSKTTCAVTERQRGTYKISDGTGKYAGISGSGRFRLRMLIRRQAYLARVLPEASRRPGHHPGTRSGDRAIAMRSVTLARRRRASATP